VFLPHVCFDELDCADVLTLVAVVAAPEPVSAARIHEEQLVSVEVGCREVVDGHHGVVVLGEVALLQDGIRVVHCLVLDLQVHQVVQQHLALLLHTHVVLQLNFDFLLRARLAFLFWSMFVLGLFIDLRGFGQLQQEWHEVVGERGLNIFSLEFTVFIQDFQQFLSFHLLRFVTARAFEGKYLLIVKEDKAILIVQKFGLPHINFGDGGIEVFERLEVEHVADVVVDHNVLLLQEFEQHHECVVFVALHDSAVRCALLLLELLSHFYHHLRSFALDEHRTLESLPEEETNVFESILLLEKLQNVRFGVLESVKRINLHLIVRSFFNLEVFDTVVFNVFKVDERHCIILVIFNVIHV